MRVLRFIVAFAVGGAVAVAISVANQPTSAIPDDHAGLTSPLLSQCLRWHKQTGEACAVIGGPSDGTYVDEHGETHFPLSN